ncbi:hypothetical protein FZC33_08340 [Labrys sp. KNU-23]|uniref:hypothetical protein n=1 Tax=Labrys sp. KNU-23 TaxID=2789216 RepID=UPI0011F028E3|nr:hypothetical protein [Labrys sp. KNU-23]QEN86182.1 hypothetical protein FZC33_08340 [Labrys sp. KNU-23]
MGIHVFGIGDFVTLRLALACQQDKAYEIIRLLPADGSEPVYRIKSIGESLERTVRQRELNAMKTADQLNILPSRR